MVTLFALLVFGGLIAVALALVEAEQQRLSKISDKWYLGASPGFMPGGDGGTGSGCDGGGGGCE